jgi:hypothetical protein
MRSIVVYESFYGNTESVAQAVADGLARHGDAKAVKVGAIEAFMLGDLDLLVVGAPTHAWGLPRAKTRAGVEASTADASQPLVREWLDSLPPGDDRPAAAFAPVSATPNSLPDRRREGSPAACGVTAGSRSCRRGPSLSSGPPVRWHQGRSKRPWPGAMNWASASPRPGRRREPGHAAPRPDRVGESLTEPTPLRRDRRGGGRRGRERLAATAGHSSRRRRRGRSTPGA